ncbi:MAG: TetR/AcrR family transcriptional regulator [Eubacterium sp.]|nr:TetR/AcrR family transcriptional regulator [Eubacterium sp.]
MKTYPAGDLTKEKIYQASKEIFFHDGYKKASMKEVSEKAGIKQSVFYYHYKNKAALAKKLYSEFGTAHATAITEWIIQNKYSNDIIISNCVCSALLIINSVTIPNIGRFWAEMYTDNLTADISFHRHFHKLIFKKRFSNFTEMEFEVFLIEAAAINCALILSYLDGRLHVKPEELARFKIQNTLKALAFTKEERDKMINEIIKIASKIPIKCGNNFEICIDHKLVF